MRRSPFLRRSLLLHAAAVPVVALAPTRWPWIAGTLVANHCVLLAGGLLPRSGMLGPNVTRDPSAAQRGAVVLTFDDGPDPEVTPRVLDVLDAHGAKASFFCIGSCVARYEELAQEMARRGHRVENHTQNHGNGFFFHGPRRLTREIDQCQEVITRATGRAPHLFRAPAGIRSPLLGPTLAGRGLALCSWTRRGFDTVARDPEAVVTRLTHGLAAGDILVLHDGARHPRAGRERVLLEALPRVLDAIAARKLEIVPVTAPDENAP